MKNHQNIQRNTISSIKLFQNAISPLKREKKWKYIWRILYARQDLAPSFFNIGLHVNGI